MRRWERRNFSRSSTKYVNIFRTNKNLNAYLNLTKYGNMFRSRCTEPFAYPNLRFRHHRL